MWGLGQTKIFWKIAKYMHWSCQLFFLKKKCNFHKIMTFWIPWWNGNFLEGGPFLIVRLTGARASARALQNLQRSQIRHFSLQKRSYVSFLTSYTVHTTIWKFFEKSKNRVLVHHWNLFWRTGSWRARAQKKFLCFFKVLHWYIIRAKYLGITQKIHENIPSSRPGRLISTALDFALHAKWS